MGFKRLTCPACNGQKLVLKYEAKYIYSYVIDNDAPGLLNTDIFFPFLYDERQQTEARQYLECTDCGGQYPCSLSQSSRGLDFQILYEVLNNDNHKETHYSH